MVLERSPPGAKIRAVYRLENLVFQIPNTVLLQKVRQSDSESYEHIKYMSSFEDWKRND
jgi:hypothetical protein